MRTRWPLLLLLTLPAFAAAQGALPPDIHPVTLSRLPPVSPEDLDEEGRRLLAERSNFRPSPGPTHITIYSPNGRNLGIPSGIVEHFGKQGTVTLMTIMGEYLKVGIMLNAVDQHLPPGPEPLLAIPAP
jgi:hypothetical protein